MTNEGFDYGTTGAKQQSWRSPNARELLARVVKENPGIDEEALFHVFSAECAAFFPEIVRYWFANNLRALLDPKRRLTKEERAALKEAAKERIGDKLLDYVLPSGRMLRDSTFGECADAGGWLTSLSKKGKPGDKVGAVLSEKEVRKIFADILGQKA